MRAAAGKAKGMMEPLLEDKDNDDTSDDDDTNDDDSDNPHKITAGQRLKMLVGKLTIMYYICNLCYAVESITQTQHVSFTRSLVWDNCRGSGMYTNDTIQWKYCDICHGRADIP